MLKKVVLSVAIGLSFLATNTTTAQIEQGQSLVSAGIGLGSYYTSGSGFKTTLPPLSASYEYMITENISVGGFAGASGSEYEIKQAAGFRIDWKTKYTYLNFGGLVNYHFVNDETFNVYAGGRLGYVSLSAKTTVNSSDREINSLLRDLIPSVTASGFTYGVQLGGRYFFYEAFSVNAELGYGIAVLQVGVTLKLVTTQVVI